jgi:hypothetical protein
MHPSPKMEKNNYSAQENMTTHLGPFECVDQTAFNLPTLGKPTMPTVMLCAALGLYALRRWNNAKASVPDAKFVR